MIPSFVGLDISKFRKPPRRSSKNTAQFVHNSENPNLSSTPHKISGFALDASLCKENYQSMPSSKSIKLIGGPPKRKSILSRNATYHENKQLNTSIAASKPSSRWDRIDYSAKEKGQDWSRKYLEDKSIGK